LHLLTESVTILHSLQVINEADLILPELQFSAWEQQSVKALARQPVVSVAGVPPAMASAVKTPVAFTMLVLQNLTVFAAVADVATKLAAKVQSAVEAQIWQLVRRAEGGTG